MGSRKVAGSAFLAAGPALLVALLIGLTFGRNTDEAAKEVVDTEVESPSAYVRFRAYRTAQMRGPRFWRMFAVSFVVVQAAGTIYLIKKPLQDPDDRLRAMSAAIRGRPPSSSDDA